MASDDKIEAGARYFLDEIVAIAREGLEAGETTTATEIVEETKATTEQMTMVFGDQSLTDVSLYLLAVAILELARRPVGPNLSI